MFPVDESAVAVEAGAPGARGSSPVTFPRNRDSDHDVSYDFVISVPRNRADTLRVEIALEEIEDRIEAIGRELATCAPLVAERARLLQARALLMDEPMEDAVPPGERRRVTRDDVAAALSTAPGSSAGKLARAVGTSQQVVSAHLYRGKANRFRNRGGRWFLRTEADPD